jgi:hypothetical protein
MEEVEEDAEEEEEEEEEEDSRGEVLLRGQDEGWPRSRWCYEDAARCVCDSFDGLSR